MTTLKKTLRDEVWRQIKHFMRLEICAVDKVNWHKDPDDHNFNSVDVVMRDRAHKDSKDNRHIRKQLPVLQNNFLGHHLGFNWNPRIGDLVYVFFYGDREGIVLGTAHSWAEFPVCMPTPYDLVLKGGQARKPYQDKWGDFPKQPYPQAKKPFCFRWWHGYEAYKKGDIAEGRDWCFLFDYCRLGDDCMDCRLCKTTDDINHILNHYFKFYSEQTESRLAYPLRGVYHNPSGSYWLFEGTDKPSEEYVSEFYTEGMGFWSIQGSTILDDIEYYKGHIRHSPNGTMEGHSATPAPEDSAGSRWKVYSPDDTTADAYGLIAAELQNLETGAVVRIYKDGSIRIKSTTAQGDKSEVWLEKTGHCYLKDIVDGTYIDFSAGGPAEIKADPLTITGDCNVTGSLTHGGVPCCNAANIWSD